MSDRIFSRYPVRTFLGGAAFISICTLFIGPIAGQLWAFSIDESIESMAIGGTIGQILGFVLSVVATIAVASRRVN